MSNAPTRFAEMTNDDLVKWLIRCILPEPYAALRDAILAERDAEHQAEMMRATREADRADETAVHWKRTAERAEADWKRSVDAHNAAIQERDALRDALASAAKQLHAAKSALGEARTKYGREALTRMAERMRYGVSGIGPNLPWYHHGVETFRDNEYPATPSGEGERAKVTCADFGYCVDAFERCETGKECFEVPATPSGEGVAFGIGLDGRVSELVIPVEDTFGVSRITITPDTARRLLALAQTEAV